MLDRDDPARTEALAVAAAVHFIEDRNLGIARKQEIGVKRVADPIVDRSRGGHQRLAQHLTAEDPLGPILGTDPAEDIDFNGLEIEERQQLPDRRVVGG